MSATEEGQNEGTWTITVEGGTALWSNIQAAVRDAMRDRKADSPGHQALKRLYEGKAEFKGRMPGLIPERPSAGSTVSMATPPRWEDGGQTLLVHLDELGEVAEMLPPHVEMRVNSIRRAAKTRSYGLMRDDFTVALKLGDDPHEVSRDDQVYIAEALEARGWNIVPPRRAPDGAPAQDPRSQAEQTAPERYREAQETREAAAGVAQTPEGRRAATYVQLGDLKTIARDKGWDLAFEWIVEHQERDEKATVRLELDTQDDDDVWRRRENVKRALVDRGVRLHDSVIETIVEAACDPALRPYGEPDATRQRVNREARDRGARRVLNVLWRDFSSEIDEVPFGRVMLTCADVVAEVLDHDYDPLIPSP